MRLTAEYNYNNYYMLEFINRSTDGYIAINRRSRNSARARRGDCDHDVDAENGGGTNAPRVVVALYDRKETATEGGRSIEEKRRSLNLFRGRKYDVVQWHKATSARGMPLAEVRSCDVM